MKLDKAPDLDVFLVLCVNKGGLMELEWLMRLLNESFDVVAGPMD